MELRPIKESTSDFEQIEKRIKQAFRLWIYLPLLRELELPQATVQNARDDLVKALQSGRITVERGTFSGKFDAKTSKELKKMGAKWNPKSHTFKLPASKQPMAIRDAISTAKVRFQERLARIDKRLSAINSVKIAGNIQTKDLFANTLSKVDREIAKTLEKITIIPKLTENTREKIADEWQNNMDLWISNFTEEEITRLRKDIAKSVFSGNRHEAIVKSIQRSYGVTANKAKFLARQETGLLLAKFKESRYTESGVHKYKWRCVAGSKNHPVRPAHKSLDGKVFRWDTPPITSEPGQPMRRNNPGQDYNCRCNAVPIVDFRKK